MMARSADTPPRRLEMKYVSICCARAWNAYVLRNLKGLFHPARQRAPLAAQMQASLAAIREQPRLLVGCLVRAAGRHRCENLASLRGAGAAVLRIAEPIGARPLLPRRVLRRRSDPAGRQIAHRLRPWQPCPRWLAMRVAAGCRIPAHFRQYPPISRVPAFLTLRGDVGTRDREWSVPQACRLEWQTAEDGDDSFQKHQRDGRGWWLYLDGRERASGRRFPGGHELMSQPAVLQPPVLLTRPVSYATLPSIIDGKVTA